MKAFCFLLFILANSIVTSQINKPINASSTLPSIQELQSNLRLLIDSETNYPKGLPLSDIVSQQGMYPEYYKTDIHLVRNDRATITVYLNGLKEIVKYSAILGSYDTEEVAKKVYQQWLPLLMLAVPEYNIDIDVTNKDYVTIKKLYKKTKDRITGFTLLQYRAADELWYVVLNYNTADNEDMGLLEIKYKKEEAIKNSLYHKGLLAMKAKEYAKASKLFAKNLKKERNDIRSMYQLGLIYRYGWGTNVAVGKAQNYFEICGHTGMAMASYEMGLVLKEQGISGLALEWFERAAKQGSEAGKRAYEYESESDYKISHPEESNPTNTTNYSISSNESVTTPTTIKKMCAECNGTGKTYNTTNGQKNTNSHLIDDEYVTCFVCCGKGHFD
jgi:hypothetical protein